MNMDQVLETFLEESRDLLQAMEDALLSLETGGPDLDAVNAMFRAAHTIKGSGGLFGLDDIVAFTHVVESVLDQVRNGKLEINGDLVTLLLSCRDHIAALIAAVAAHEAQLPDEVKSVGEDLARQLRARLAPAQPAAPAPGSAESPEAVQIESDGSVIGADHWHLSLRFGPEVLKNGMDPLSFIHYLGTLGQIVHLETLPDAMPPAEAMDPEICYLGFEIDFKSDAEKPTIESVFDFVKEDSKIRILPPRSKVADYVNLIQDLPEDTRRLGEILIAGGTLTRKELEEALALQSIKPSEPSAAPLGEILVQEGMVHQQVVNAALDKQKQVEEKKVQDHKFIKIEAAKLDHLINLVGELVIAGASANVIATRAHNPELAEATSVVSHLVEDIRDSALQLRMVQIGETLQRFPRVVRDLAKELGKDIDLLISGAEAELDKTMVDKIADPLTHLVRNAIDHGIESREARLLRNKAEKGTVRLNAYHDSGSIVIEVADDGGGLNKQKILDKAIEKGIVSPDQSLTDQEIINLIMEPGFSTAEQVTNISGRGVGMDVVKRNIESLRGQVEIESEEGKGTTVKIRLPLTLAIIDGFLVGVGKASYVLPLDMVVECVELPEQPEQAERHYTNLRGEVLPFLRLRELFELEGQKPKRENIVVVNYAGNRAGLVVDELLGEFQTVIKPLSKIFGYLKGIGGSTILGSGEVALILDVPMLVSLIVNREAEQNARAGARRVALAK